MNSVISVLKILVLNMLLQVSSQKLGGAFYVLNEGFSPRTFENEYISYMTELRSMKEDWEDKRINGWFYLKQNIKCISFSVQSWVESGKMWLPRGPPVPFPNVCILTTVQAKNFMKCFSGTFNLDPCSLDAGNYTLTSYNVEEDLKQAVGNNFFYGRFKYAVTLSGIVDEKTLERRNLQFNLIASIKDAEHKPPNVKSGPGKNKPSQSKTHQTKKKTG